MRNYLLESHWLWKPSHCENLAAGWLWLLKLRMKMLNLSTLFPVPLKFCKGLTTFQTQMVFHFLAGYYYPAQAKLLWMSACQLMIAKAPNPPLVHSPIKNHHDGPLATASFYPRKFKISAKVPLVRNKGLPSGWMWQEDITFSIQISASQNPQCPTEMERKTVQSFLGNQEVMGWRRTLYLV